MKKANKPINVRPNQIECLKCHDHGICEAETGNPNYKCPFIVCKITRESI